MNLKSTLNNTPSKPGVYIFKNEQGLPLYIGKAKHLKKRVSSYFQKTENLEHKTQILVKKIADIEFIITDNELEALILENILIKKESPRFNIKLRDDKNYQFIKIDYSHPIPQIYPVRKRTQLKKSALKSKYYGPYTSGLKVRQILKLIKKIFPYCTAKDIGTRPCFNYQLHRCPGVCIGEISLKEYHKQLEQVELFLKGKNQSVVKNLKQRLKKLSKEKRFEKAAVIRDQLKAIEHLTEEQKIISPQKVDRDYISLSRDKKMACINIFLVREGKLISGENIILQNISEEQGDDTLLTAFIEQYYTDTNNIPREVLLPTSLPEEKLLKDFLQKRLLENQNKALKIKIRVPQKGASAHLLSLGEKNARNHLEKEQILKQARQTKATQALTTLQKHLNLKNVPQRLEAYDISNIQGKMATGSMVVFSGDKPQKDQYRKFRIRLKDTPDDYQMMNEVINRRFNNPWPHPDLIIIDGGKGQLNIALSVLKERNLKIPVIALSKDRESSKHEIKEKIHLPSKENPLKLPGTDPGLQLLQRIRDEAHRFAISYHRQLRSKNLLKGK